MKLHQQQRQAPRYVFRSERALEALFQRINRKNSSLSQLYDTFQCLPHLLTDNGEQVGSVKRQELDEASAWDDPFIFTLIASVGLFLV